MLYGKVVHKPSLKIIGNLIMWISKPVLEIDHLKI